MAIKELSDCSDSDEMQSKEMKEVTGAKFEKTFGDAWVNKSLEPIKTPITCRVPQKILIMMRSIERMMSSSGMGSLEFGAYLKGALDDDGILMITEDFYVGAQRVTGVTVDFDEDPPSGLNGVIHRHPGGCTSFSGVDDGHINKNFDFSLLYVNDNITKGILNLKFEKFRIQVPLNVQIMYPVIAGSLESLVKKIKKKESMSSSASKHSITQHLLMPGDGMLPFAEPEDGDTDEDINVDDSFNLNQLAQEDEEDDLYICKECGEPQYIDGFPHDCESCDKELTVNDVNQVVDITELDEDTQMKIYVKKNGASDT
jgi:hypothetical protein